MRKPTHWGLMWESRADRPRPFLYHFFERDPANERNFFVGLGIGPVMVRYCNPPVASAR